MMSEVHRHYLVADESYSVDLARGWSDVAARHLHFADGFSLLALDGDIPVGLIAVQWRDLPTPFVPGACEGFIDFLEVRPEVRRQGIATALECYSASRRLFSIALADGRLELILADELERMRAESRKASWPYLSNLT